MKIKEYTSIIIKGQKEEEAVLKKLEDMGYKWNEGELPTKFKPKELIGSLDIGEDMCFGYSVRIPFYKNTITAKKFLGESCIVIYKKGAETIALDKSTGKKAVAKCSPDDTYDFYTGAELALSRLIGHETKETETPKFKPYLRFALTKEFLGNIGENTPIKDVIGRELRIGDTVELYNKENMYEGEKVIAYDGWAFVMGIQIDCEKDGTINGGWKIILKRGYEEIANGKIIDCVKYVKEEE